MCNWQPGKNKKLNLSFCFPLNETLTIKASLSVFYNYNSIKRKTQTTTNEKFKEKQQIYKHGVESSTRQAF